MRLMHLAIGTLLGMAGALIPLGALAHSGLVSSSPAADALLNTPPDEVVLTFDGELSPDGTSFTVTDANGGIVGEGELDLTVADRSEVRGAANIVEPGVFTVAWTSVAADGHAETGEFTFSVAPATATNAPDTAATPSHGPVPAALGVVLVAVGAAIALRRARRGAS
jgi:methionine-rich copper-binding protein CopC